MKSIFKRTAVVMVCILCFMSAFACKEAVVPNPDPEEGEQPDLSRGYTYAKQADSLMQFYSSDSELDFFLNDYMERHLRYNDKAIHSLQLGAGNSIWKEWESMAVMFMDTTTLSYDPKETIKSWVSSVYQDSFGYIWMDNGLDSSSWGQSWEFPNAKHSAGNTGTYNNHQYTFDTNNENEGWEASANNASAVKSVKNGTFSVVGTNLNTVTFETKTLDTFMANTFHAPFLEILLNISDADNLMTNQLSDIIVSWKTEGDTNYTSSKSVKYSEFAITDYGTSFPSTAKVTFPMYANDNWSNDKKVIDMKIDVIFKDGINGSVGLNDVDLSYDARQINNNGVFIAAVANYYEYTQDMEFLKANIDKVRRAMQFYLAYCDGQSGLVSTHNFAGHDGSTNADYFEQVAFNGGMSNGINGIGQGIGDGYWDCLSYPMVSSYCNNLYYLSLQKLLYLEQMMLNTAKISGGGGIIRS